MGFRYIGESKDRVLYVSIAVEDEIEYCIVALRGGSTEGPGVTNKATTLRQLE
jgi:hypothetical protein